MLIEIPFWNKVDVDNLTVELLENEDWYFLKVYTNKINIFNNKIEKTDEYLKEKFFNIIELAEEINEHYILEDYDKFKEKSNELMRILEKI